MIQYLNIKKHKALSHSQMLEIGNLNVICGKNNSGKTTILEALKNDQSYGIGKKLDNADWLVELFTSESKRYSNPNPKHSIQWFRNCIDELIRKNTVWYSDDREGIIQSLQSSQKADVYLRQHTTDIFNFNRMLDDFFKKSVAFYNPLLIPPKRQIEFQVDINLKQEINLTGSGIINKLFFLKNQDFESDDYKVYTKIYDIFYDITGSRFNIVPDTNNQIKLYYKTGEKWISASDCGLGLSDILMMITILNVMNNNIFLLEEPENHLHAEYQKRLLKYLQTLKSKQFFITTHSSVFLDTNVVEKIFHCTNNGEVLLSDQTSKSKIIDSLGYSVTENLVADLIVFLEGPTDIPVIREMLNWLDVSSNYNIKFWALGGDIMASLDLSVFSERNNVFALVDSDPGSSVQRTRFINHCAINGIYCQKLERYSIENYFPLQAIKKAFPDQIPSEIQNISPRKSVDTQIGFKEKDKTIKIKNSEIVKHMNISDIEGTDLHAFLIKIKSFFA